MIYVITALYDKAACAYGRPWSNGTLGLAVRGFTDEARNPESELFKHLSDYDLYELGRFDDSSGSFDLLDKPKLVLQGASFIND